MASEKSSTKKTKDSREKYDTSFYSIRRAHPVDLPQIINLIVSEPYFRWKQLIQLLIGNMYVTVTWFVCALAVIGLAIAYFAVSKIQFKSRVFYIALAISTALLVFAVCYMKATTLYFMRYIDIFEMQSILSRMDERTLSDNQAILSNHKVHLFWKLHSFYLAEPYDQASKKLCLGVISLTNYTDYCKRKQISDKDFEVIVKAVPDGFRLVSHKTVVVSWCVINEKLFAQKTGCKEDNERLRNSVCHGLLQYIDKKVIADTSINYVIAECDDFLYWKHDVLMENQYGFCGERVDLKWDFYYQITHEGFPNNQFFFIKVCNIDPRVFEKALQREQRKKQKQVETDDKLI